jgi:recombination protein RecA
VEENLIADLNRAMRDINKRFGVGTVMRLGENPDITVPVVSTGSLLLDLATGKGGLPVSRVIELYGPPQGGKTTMSLYHAAEVQKTGRLVGFVDAEHSLNLELARQYGVNIEELVLNQPQTGEEGLDVAEALARTGLFGLIIVDSVSALVPEAEAEAEMSQQSMGLHARLMSKALRKLTPVMAENNCTIIFINQIREKINSYGNPETTTGGRGLPFYASMRIEIRQNGGTSGLIKDKAGNIIGHQIKCKIVKNKIAVPYKEAIISLIYGVGLERASEIVTIALASGLIKQGGAWFTYKEEGQLNAFKVQGRENMESYLTEHPEIMAEIEEEVMRGVVA